MSAILPKADIRQRCCDVRFGQTADIALSNWAGLPASRLPRRIISKAPAIPQIITIASAVLGSMLLSRHGPVCNIRWHHNNPAVVTKMLA
jgi:hypothetical protein